MDCQFSVCSSADSLSDPCPVLDRDVLRFTEFPSSVSSKEVALDIDQHGLGYSPSEPDEMTVSGAFGCSAVGDAAHQTLDEQIVVDGADEFNSSDGDELAEPPRDWVPGGPITSADISQCAVRSDWIGALKLLEELWIWEVPTSEAYESVMRACEKVGQWQRCLSLLGEMADCRLSRGRSSFEVPIRACQGACQWEHAAQLLLEMQRTEETQAHCGTTSSVPRRAQERHKARTIPVKPLGVDCLEVDPLLRCR